MKEKELRAAADCAVCGKAFGHSGLPLFWRVTIERHGVLMDRVKRQDGLSQFLGGNCLLAQVMGPDEELTQKLMGPVTITVCEHCAQQAYVYPIAYLAERADNEQKEPS